MMTCRSVAPLGLEPVANAKPQAEARGHDLSPCRSLPTLNGYTSTETAPIKVGQDCSNSVGQRFVEGTGFGFSFFGFLTSFL